MARSSRRHPAKRETPRSTPGPLYELDVPRPPGSAESEPVRIRGDNATTAAPPRQRAAAGLAANFFVANPDFIGGALHHVEFAQDRLQLVAGRAAPPTRAGAAVPDQLRVRQGDADRVLITLRGELFRSVTPAHPVTSPTSSRATSSTICRSARAAGSSGVPVR